jgi:hypothetical protein
MELVRAHTAMINGNAFLHDSTPHTMKSAREIIAKVEMELKEVIRTEKYNVRRIITIMDHRQQAKNNA